MGAERTGTVTFLFTDIEGSTRRWAEDETAMAAALDRHDTTLRTAIEQNAGQVFKHTGDGMAAVFDSATAAVHAALVAQADLELPVRMGLHTGVAERRGDDYYGSSLNRCARIMDAGHGGQVLVSTATRELLDGLELTLVDLGRHRLRGFDEPVGIHQVGPGDHPPLRTSTADVRLPVVSAALVGRDDIVHEVVAEIDGHRLVTLTGVGGVGKTRIAIAAAEARSDRHELVAFVDFGAITDDEEVIAAACRTLGITDHRSSALELALDGRNALLVLDNCEHVLAAAADLADDLMRIPGLRIVATSREGLGLAGERILAVPGLPSDTDDSAAVQMFLDRAHAIGADVGRDHLPVVRDICRRLDGLPLAIELAAARVAVLSPEGLLARLDERFQLLTSGRRKRSRDRHTTLRDTIDWSYELLDHDERDLFELMAVFGGSFALDSAVVMGGGRAEFEVLDLLAALIDKSLLSTVDIDDERRYRYLETIRNYAQERFDARPDADDVLASFGAYLAALVADQVESIHRDPRRSARRLRAEIPNLRAGFDHALDRGDVATLTALLGPLAGINQDLDWQVSGWAAEALALDGAAGSVHEAELLAAHLVERWLEGRFDLMRELAERIRAAGRRRDDPSPAADSVTMTGYMLVGDDDGLIGFADELLERYPPDHDMVMEAGLMRAWIRTEPASGGPALALSPQDEATLAAAIDHPRASLRLTALTVRALDARRRADYQLMLRCSNEVTELAVPASPRWFTGVQIRSFAEHYLGRPGAAIRTTDADLDEAYRLGDRSAMVLPLLADALVLESLGELEAAATIRGRLPRRMTAMFISELTDLDRRLRERIEPERWRELTAIGAAMSPRELQDLTHRTARRHLDLDDPAAR